MSANPWRDVDPVPWDTVTADGARFPPCEECGSGGFPADLGLRRVVLYCERVNVRQPVKTTEVVHSRFLCLHCAVKDALAQDDQVTAWLLTDSRDSVAAARRDPTSLSYRASLWDPPVA